MIMPNGDRRSPQRHQVRAQPGLLHDDEREQQRQRQRESTTTMRPADAAQEQRTESPRPGGALGQRLRPTVAMLASTMTLRPRRTAPRRTPAGARGGVDLADLCLHVAHHFAAARREASSHAADDLAWPPFSARPGEGVAHRTTSDVATVHRYSRCAFAHGCPPMSVAQRISPTPRTLSARIEPRRRSRRRSVVARRRGECLGEGRPVSSLSGSTRTSWNCSGPKS